MSAEVEAKASMAALADNILKAMELAKEFRRLAAEAEKKREYYQFDRQAHAGFAVERNTWNRAAQMLEEKLNG